MVEEKHEGGTGKIGLNKETYGPFLYRRKPYIFTAKKCHWKNTNVCIGKLSDLPQKVKVTTKSHSNSKWNRQLSES